MALEPTSAFGVRGRVIVVTGASSGIGAWLATGLAQAGASVVVTARRADALASVADALPNTTAIAGDITDDRHRARLVQDVIDRFGRLDGLVNNAGSLRV